jgi:uncharacterized membrane protein YfcA
MTATGLAGGFFSGLTGVGGGAIMVPLMTGVLRMRQHTAHGTSLVIIVFAAGASAVTYIAQGSMDWPLVALLLPGSLVGVYSGARLVQFLPAMRLRQAFGLFVFIVGIRLLAFQDINPLVSVSGASEVLAGGVIGLAGGILSGSLGVGGGAIFVPSLVIVLGTGQHEAQGASLAVIVATALLGAWTHHRHGSLDLKAARWIAPAAVPAGIAGAFVATRMSGIALERTFAIVAVGVGIQMLLTATRGLRGERLTAATPAIGTELL